MSKLFVQVERVEDLIGRADNYFGCDLCGEDSVDATVFAYAEKKKPLTNYDRIRAKSVEEMAEFINGVEAETIRRAGLFITVGDIQRGKEGWLDWLKQEVSSDSD